MNQLDKVFARRFSSKTAIDALIGAHITTGSGRQRACLDQSLALNLNLSSDQITALFKETGQLESFKDTDHLATAVLLATRLDLTSEQIWAVIRSSNRTVRQALFSPRGEIWNHKAALDDQMMEYLFTQKWFTTCDPDIFALSIHADLFRLSGGAYYSLQAVYNSRHPSNPLIAVTGRQENIRTLDHSWPKAYEKRDDIRRSIQNENNWEEYYLNQELLKFDPSEITENYYKGLDVPLSGIKISGRTSLLKFSQVVEEATQGYDVNFYRMFFSLLPDWRGSVNELIQSAASLTQGATAQIQ